MVQRLFGGVMLLLATALAASPFMLVDSAGSASVALDDGSAGASSAAAPAHAVAEAAPNAAPFQAPSPDEVLAAAARENVPIELGSVDLLDQSVVCDNYNGNCEPPVVCSVTDLTLGHDVRDSLINLVINGSTDCQEGRIEFTPIVGGRLDGTGGELIPGVPLTIQAVDPGTIEVRGTFDPNNCGLGATVRFRVEYIRRGLGRTLAFTDTVRLPICDLG